MPRSYSFRIQLAGFLFSILTACLVFTTTAQGPAANRVDSIHAEELREKVTFLASEQLKGRGKGYLDRKSTRLNSSHANISYAVFCLKKKKKKKKHTNQNS